MKPKLLVFFSLLLSLSAPALAQNGPPRYAVAVLPTPVLNSPDFSGVFGGPDGTTLRVDHCGQIRALEFIALPGTPFRIEAKIATGRAEVYRVTTDDYPYPSQTGYYVDSRFVAVTEKSPPPRRRELPTREEIIANLLAARGSAYVWGGNIRGGIPEMLSFFPPHSSSRFTSETERRWQLKGVDCSGLLYQATDGFTPRNTSALVRFGERVPIAGLGKGEIVRHLEPLDLIVWQGHVMIVIDNGRLIESRLNCARDSDGVRVRPLTEALAELMKNRRPMDDWPEGGGAVKGFVVRRWYGRAASAHPAQGTSGRDSAAVRGEAPSLHPDSAGAERG